MQNSSENNSSRPHWKHETIEQTRERLRRPWGDYPLTVLIINPINLRLVRLVGRTPITPNQLTFISFLCMLISALFLSSPRHAFNAAGGILLLVAYLIDCLDGDLARYKHIKSPLGAMLDSILDRCGEFVIAMGLSINGWRVTGDSNWLIAGLVLIGMTQIYFYITDGILNKLMSETGRSKKSRSLTIWGTKVVFGAYEPFMWGQAGLAIAGLARWCVPIFGLMFTLCVIIQIYRVILNSKNLLHDQSTSYGPHIL